MSLVSAIKPVRWNASLGLINPNWRWAWRNPIAICPVWEKVGPIFDLAGRNTISLDDGLGDGPMIWTTTPRGPGLSAGGTGATEQFTGSGVHSAGLLDFPITVCAVIHVLPGSGNNDAPLIGVSRTSSEARYIQVGTGFGKLLLGRISLGGGNRTINGVTTLTENSIVTAFFVTRSNTDHELFLNGVSETTSAADSGTDFSTTNGIRIGSPIERSDDTLLAGYIWPFELTTAQMKQVSGDPFGTFRMDAEALLFDEEIIAAVESPIVIPPYNTIDVRHRMIGY